MEVKRPKITKRNKPNKKWTEDEIRQILNYLQDAAEIEAPTAQIFYRKLIEITGIDATWELLRWKVRHLKASFKKANDWRDSTGSGLLEADAGTSSVEGKVLQMCPHYKQLEAIFGVRNRNTDFEIVDSGDLVVCEETTELLNYSLEECLFDEDSGISTSPNPSNSQTTPTLPHPQTTQTLPHPQTTQTLPHSQTTQTLPHSQTTPTLPHSQTTPTLPHSQTTPTLPHSQTTPTLPHSQTTPTLPRTKTTPTSIKKKATEFAEKMKRKTPKSSAAHLAAFQVERTEMMKIKIEWEKEKHAKDLALSERKLKMEEEKMKAEIERGKAEIENKRRELELKELQLKEEERIKIFQLEKEERIQKYEIEMKYKYHSQQ